MHADVHGASVVIVKGKTEHMDEVAQFAASYSGAWRSGHFSADVYSVLPPQVSKTPEYGEFVSRGSFIVRANAPGTGMCRSRWELASCSNPMQQ